MRANIVCLLLVLCQFCTLPASATNTSGSTPTPENKTTTPSDVNFHMPIDDKKDVTGSTTPKPEDECASHNDSCESCVSAKEAKCLYCQTNKRCMKYPGTQVLPTSVCKLSDARWGVCWLNFESLLISLGVIGGTIVLLITCCCIYCCCCRSGKKKTKYLKEEVKLERQKEERKQANASKRADRKERLDEIRRKYGLIQDDAPPYQRFEA